MPNPWLLSKIHEDIKIREAKIVCVTCVMPYCVFVSVCVVMIQIPGSAPIVAPSGITGGGGKVGDLTIRWKVTADSPFVFFLKIIISLKYGARPTSSSKHTFSFTCVSLNWRGSSCQAGFNVCMCNDVYAVCPVIQVALLLLPFSAQLRWVEGSDII